VSSSIASVFGSFALFMSGAASLTSVPYIWIEWMMGDSIGILMLTPLILLWWNNYDLPKSNLKWLEVALYTASVVTISILIFQHHEPILTGYPLKYIVIPLILWGAFRFGLKGVSTICFIISVVAIADVAEQLNIASFWAIHQDLIYLW